MDVDVETGGGVLVEGVLPEETIFVVAENVILMSESAKEEGTYSRRPLELATARSLSRWASWAMDGRERKAACIT